jgi:large subunit ribosomal protein L22
MVGKSLAKVLDKKGTPTAKLRFISIPPRKMRLVADMVKGMPIEKAIDTLNFTPRIAAHHLAKTLKSAATNLLSEEGTDHLHPEDLVVKNITVDPAPTAKRIQFQSMGRVFRIKKRFCHVSIWLDMNAEAEARIARGDDKTDGRKRASRKTATAPKSAPKKTATTKTAKKTASKKAAKNTKADSAKSAGADTPTGNE